MFFKQQLPNDLLHNAPWHETIATWPANDAFVVANGEAEEKLRELGYYVLYGVEANSFALTSSEVSRVIGKKQDLLWRQAVREQYRRDYERVKGLPPSTQQFADIYVILEELAAKRQEQQKRAPNPETQAWLDNWNLTQSFYAQARSNFETSDIILARKNFLIASLHLLPQSAGGLAGLIEQRFSSEHFGKGWWDGDNIMEFRTLPMRGHENAISSFHEILWKLKNAAEYFNLVPLSEMGAAQVHFSVWRTKDNINLFTLKDPESLAIQAKLAETMRDRLILASMQYPSKVYSPQILNHDQPIVGSSRASTIRICESDRWGGHWELRLGYSSGVTHVARDIYLIASSLRDYLEPLSPEARHNEELLVAAQKLADEQAPNKFIAIPMQDFLAPDLTESRPVRIVRKMIVTAEGTRLSCPFKSSLEGGFINDNGEVDVPIATLQWNYKQMLNQLGKGAEDLFTAEINGEAHDLKDPAVWRELFKKLKPLADGEMDTSALHPRLAIPFVGLKIVDYHMDIHGGELREDQAVTNVYTNHVMTKWLAAGKVDLFGRKPSPTEQSIYQFLSERTSIFDPQEAATYLVKLYHSVGGYTADNHQDIAKLVETASQQIFLESIGEQLGRRRAYPSPLLEKLDCFPEHEVLRYIISLRQSLLKALPEVSTYDSPKTEQFFTLLEKYLREPESIYTPQNFSSILTGIAGDHKDRFKSLGSENPDVETIQWTKDFLFNSSYSMSAMFVRVTAADQSDDVGMLKVLSRFSNAADMAVKRFYAPPPRRKDTPSDMYFAASQRGLREGVLGEAERLLADPSPLVSLRVRALEGLRIGD